WPGPSKKHRPTPSSAKLRLKGRACRNRHNAAIANGKTNPRTLRLVMSPLPRGSCVSTLDNVSHGRPRMRAILLSELSRRAYAQEQRSPLEQLFWGTFPLSSKFL